MTDPNQATEDGAFVDHAMQLNDMARLCAEAIIYRVELHHPDDRNTILRAVISRLQDALP